MVLGVPKLWHFRVYLRVYGLKQYVHLDKILLSVLFYFIIKI